VFKKLWTDESGPRLEHLLRNTVHTSTDARYALADIQTLLTDREYLLEPVDELRLATRSPQPAAESL
jgi:hypothetical protein